MRAYLRQMAGVVLALVVASFLPARAASVFVVLSAEAGPYRDAERSLKQTLENDGHRFTSVLLADVSKRPDSIPKGSTVVAIGTDAAVWAQKNASEPVYYCMVPNVGDSGLDKGRICRGVTTEVPLNEQFALIATALPKTKTVGMLFSSSSPQSVQTRDRVRSSLPNEWKLEAVDLNSHESKSKAIDELISRNIDIVWTNPDPGIYDTASIRSLLLAALRRAIPVYGFSQALVRAGGYIGASIDSSVQGRQLGKLVADDLKSSQGSTLKAITLIPEHSVVINLIAAEKLKIDVPEPIIKQATVVFKDENAK